MDDKCHSDVVSDENEEHVIVQCRKWQRNWRNCAHVLVFCGRQNLTMRKFDTEPKLYLKQSTESEAWFFLTMSAVM